MEGFNMIGLEVLLANVLHGRWHCDNPGVTTALRLMKLVIYTAKHNETIHWSREFQISEGDCSARIHGTALFIDGMWPGR